MKNLLASLLAALFALAAVSTFAAATLGEPHTTVAADDDKEKDKDKEKEDGK
ncbi:MAG TPA: hypothetical protein VHG88_14215 [Burkholderiales bacterium]|nr:hypothetical protein [Burkholderiales bacterium]